MIRFLFIMLGLLLMPGAGHAESRTSELDHWLQGDLIPWAGKKLAAMPIFEQQSLRFVVTHGDIPQSEGSTLALGLRDRFRDAVADLPGIHVKWRGDQGSLGMLIGQATPDCTADQVDYFIALEVNETSRGQVEVDVSAIDVRERLQVPGFNKRWVGRVNPAERRQMHSISADPTFRGAREAPWRDDQTDLIAATIARDLGCKILGQTDGEYVLQTVQGEPDAAIVELVQNNLSGISSLSFSTSVANAELIGRAHRIDGELYQYWVTLQPQDAASDLPTLSASTYFELGNTFARPAFLKSTDVSATPVGASYLSDLQLVRLSYARRCAAVREDTCLALNVSSSADAVAFFVQQQARFGLVRLGDDVCRAHPDARIARSDRPVQLELPSSYLRQASFASGDEWHMTTDVDRFYVIAANNTEAARALTRHIGQLPVRCSDAARQGLSGLALHNWIETLVELDSQWGDAIDWRGIRIRDIY